MYLRACLTAHATDGVTLWGPKKKNTHPPVVIFTQGSILADMVLPLTRHSTADDRVFKTYPLGVLLALQT